MPLRLIQLPWLRFNTLMGLKCLELLSLVMIFLVSGRFASMVDTPGSAMPLLSVSSRGHLLFATILPFCLESFVTPYQLLVLVFLSDTSYSQRFVGQWSPWPTELLSKGLWQLCPVPYPNGTRHLIHSCPRRPNKQFTVCYLNNHFLNNMC